MRHVFTQSPITAGPGGVMKTTRAGRLVTLSGGALRVTTGTLRAISRAIALSSVTAAAQQDLTAA